MRAVDVGLAEGWLEVDRITRPARDLVIRMRLVSVFANGLGSELEQLKGDLRSLWRQASRTVMAIRCWSLPSLGLAPDCLPVTQHLPVPR